MAAEIADHREALLLHIALDRKAQITQRPAWTYCGQAPLQRLIGDIDQHCGTTRDRLHPIHAAAVAKPSVQDRSDIDIQDVALMQPAITGNAVADHMVDRDT